MLYVSIIIFSALLYTYYHFRDRVPILMYHRIASVPGDRNALPEEKFEEQMRYLEENGFHSITVDELQAHQALSMRKAGLLWDGILSQSASPVGQGMILQPGRYRQLMIVRGKQLMVQYL